MDETDWTPLNELPPLPVDEVTFGSELVTFPFLTLYTPSGKNYHILTNQTKARIGN